MALDTSTGVVRVAFYPRLLCRRFVLCVTWKLFVCVYVLWFCVCVCFLCFAFCVCFYICAFVTVSCFRHKVKRAGKSTTAAAGGSKGAGAGDDKELRLPVIPGRSATCHGLQTATQYNGESCQVLSYNSDTGRFIVSIQMDGATKTLKIKRSNLAGMSVVELQHGQTLHMREQWKRMQYSGFYESIIRLEMRLLAQAHHKAVSRDREWISKVVEAHGKFAGFADDSNVFFNLDERDYRTWEHQRKMDLMEVNAHPDGALGQNNTAPAMCTHNFTIEESYSVRSIQTLLARFWRVHGKQMKRTWARKDRHWRLFSLVFPMLLYLDHQIHSARKRQGTLSVQT